MRTAAFGWHIISEMSCDLPPLLFRQDFHAETHRSVFVRHAGDVLTDELHD
jgi:hypothetical protein